MSYIQFESSRVKEAERKAIREAREIVLEKAKKEYEKRKEREVQAKLRGDDKWMLPSVEARITEESRSISKRKKSKHKKKKKKKKSKKSSSSSSDSDSEEAEWVEKVSDAKNERNPESAAVKQESDSVANTERDEWMSLPGLIPCVSRHDLKQQKLSKDPKIEEQKKLLNNPGQSERELNPYWKDGGTGLPEEMPKHSLTASHGVGDKGAEWLRRALRRAHEQAEEEGRSVEEVAAERWGSLQKLKLMIEEADQKAKGRTYNDSRPGGSSSHYRQSDREKYVSNEGRGRDVGRGRMEYHDTKRLPYSNDDRNKWKNCDESNQRKRDRHDYRDRNSSSSSSAFRKPAMDSDEEEGNARSSSKGFRKPSNDTYSYSSSSRNAFRKPAVDSDEEEGNDRSSSKGFRKPSDDSFSSSKYSYGTSKSGGGSGGWRKKGTVEKVVKEEIKPKTVTSSESSSEDEREKEEEKEEVREELLTDKEMNELGAKLVKAEILGNEELAKELKMKLEKAREVRKKLVATGGESMKRDDGENKEEVVVLTRTDARGFSRPVASSDGKSQDHGKRRKKVETHSDGKRVRYFADDDKYSLKEMFEREKLNTVEDNNEMFSKLAAKGIGKPESVNDMDDIFEENARFTKSAQKLEVLDRNRAIAEHKKVNKALEDCRWCFDSKLMLKHLIVAIGTKAYLCLPPHQSLTEGHCMIVPMYHTPCATQVDEDVWNEIQEFRKTLTKMFLEMDQDCVFFETAVHLKKFPHMVLECVPMEKETGDLAPIYFKKAIQECEMEWSNNVKVVDLSQKDVRKAIPKGLPYFSVDFGLQNGFAHVIEDERQWPSNFAQEIIGGMLDLDHHRWRKKRGENFEDQRKKVLQFAKWWKPHDWTQKLKRKKSDSESD